jgi:hypothetical protein
MSQTGRELPDHQLAQCGQEPSLPVTPQFSANRTVAQESRRHLRRRCHRGAHKHAAPSGSGWVVSKRELGRFQPFGAAARPNRHLRPPSAFRGLSSVSSIADMGVFSQTGRFIVRRQLA